MSNPLPFQIGQAIGKDVGGRLKERRERAPIEEIVAEAKGRSQQTGQPIDYDDMMTEVLSRVSQDRQKPILDFLASKRKTDYDKQKAKRIQENLTKRGYKPEDAELYTDLTTGGQTAFAKDVLEGKQRGQDAFGEEIKVTEDLPDGKEVSWEEEFKDYMQSQKTGLTPKERYEQGKQRYATGLPEYKELQNNIKTNRENEDRYKILSNLQKSDKLPKGLGRINVNKDGNLHLPFLASPESQRFVKTLNEFSAGAKETFGARVTNFDLQQFLRRFPNLLNSAEGREQVLKQMQIVNDINKEVYGARKDIINRAGGLRNIDMDAVDRLAEKKAAPKIEKLREKFDEIGSFPSLPNPTEFKGKKIKNKKTGETMISDGEKWSPV